MAEYIKKTLAVKAVEDGCGLCGEEMQNITGIEIVFCKECIYFDSYYRFCVHHSGLVDPEGDCFCNYGKAKEQ